MTWLPTVLLVGGIAVGVGYAWLSGRRDRRAASGGDIELRAADLEARRDEIYRELRENAAELSEADRKALERSAARAIKELEALVPARARRRKGKAVDALAAETMAPASPPHPNFSQRHPLLAGALFGGGMVALVSVLIFWAVRDAAPDASANQGQAMSGGGAAAQTGAQGDDFRGQPELPPMVESQIVQMRAQLQTDPEDSATRRNLAQLLIAHGQFFDAFQEAQQLLARDPSDPDGTYVSGVVRFTMGQVDEALAQFRLTLENEPTYSSAALLAGLVELQMGDLDQAMQTWEAGLAAVDGADPRIDHVLGLARAGKSVEEIMSTPPS